MPEVLERWLPPSLEPGPERWLFLLVSLSVALGLISIAASQALFFSAVLGFVWERRRGRISAPPWPAVGWPLAAFFLWTVAAALASPDALLGLTIVKKFGLFLILFIAPRLLRGKGRTIWSYGAVFCAAAASALAGIGQYVANPQRDFLNRITGFTGGWMTFSGLQMLALVMLAGYALAYGIRRWWVPALGLVLVASLCLSFTRNAWLGAAAGVTVVFALRRSRALVGVLAVVAGLLLTAPRQVGDRLRAAWSVEDTTTRGRLELFSTSLRLIRDHPWFGVGPKTVNTQALRYRGTREFPDWLYQHMHNNFLQIAAERGLPGLALWIWFMLQLAREALAVLRSVRAGLEPDRDALVAASTALGAETALVVSGLFEYNFGDSEVLTLFLFIMAAPRAFSVRRRRGERMKLAILGTRGIPANYGGFETFAEECGAGLAARGHDVTVYCRSHYVAPTRERYRGVRLVVLPTLRLKHTDTVVHTMLSVVHALPARYDAILICNAANAVFSFIPRLAGVAVALNVDGIERRRRKWSLPARAYYRLSEYLSTILPNALVTDARVIERYYRDHYGAESDFIPYGALTDRPRPGSTLERLGLEAGGYFLYVSRLEPENNAHLVVAAYREVRGERPLVVVGDAPYARNYIARVRAAADPRVLFAGAIYGAPYRELQAHALCYVHATEVGGTHPALIEAMGQGSLIVCNATEENREVLGDAGLYYRVNDLAELRALLQDVADSPERHAALKAAAAARARSCYCWDTVVDRYEELFRKLATAHDR